MVGAQLGQITKQTNKQRDKLNDDHQQRNNNIKTKKKKITKKTNKPKSELITAQVFDDDIFALVPIKSCSSQHKVKF